MKRIMLAATLLLLPLSAMAEKTICMENNAGGFIHLIQGESQIVLSTNPNGSITKGKWALTEKSVMIKWDSGNMSMFSKKDFKVCEI